MFRTSAEGVLECGEKNTKETSIRDSDTDFWSETVSWNNINIYMHVCVYTLFIHYIFYSIYINYIYV